MIIVTPSSVSEKLRFFPFTRKQKAVVFKFLRFEKRFRKAVFLGRISVDGRPNRRNKAAFSCRISVDGRPNRRNKAAFSCRISVDGRPNRRNKAAFVGFSSLMWALPPSVNSCHDCACFQFVREH